MVLLEDVIFLFRLPRCFTAPYAMLRRDDLRAIVHQSGPLFEQ